MKVKHLKLSVLCSATYNSSIDVPADMSLKEAVIYAQEHSDDIPLTELTYLPDSDIVEEEYCSLEEQCYCSECGNIILNETDTRCPICGVKL